MRRKKAALMGTAVSITLLMSACADGATGPIGTPLFSHTEAGNSTVVVHPGNLNGWITAVDGGSGTATTFVNGPETPPAGIGSVQFTIGADGNDFTEIRTPHFDGVQLTSITNLSYSTYVQQNLNAQAAYLILNVDLDGNGSTDDLLFFEPVYQNGTYTGVPVPNQCGVNPNCVTTGEWQTWNALVGGWWSLNAGTFGPPNTTLAVYAAANPGARLAVDGAGSLRISTGSGAGAWDNFIGNADALTIGINGDNTTYDFELQAPAPTTADQCKNGGWMTLARADGSTFKNQGDCIQYVNTGK